MGGGRSFHGLRRFAAVLFALALASACTDVVIVEGSEASCRNGLDDDGNGARDCDDPACRDSGACERTFEACRDGIDEDRDQKTDCEDPDCIALGACEPFDRACSVLPQVVAPANAASDTLGCPIGMACYPKRGDFDGGRCMLPGAKGINRSCQEPSECLPGSNCTGLCSPTCRTDAECPRGGYCAHYPDRVGACLIGCAPAMGEEFCAANTRCITLHAFEQRYLQTPALAVCSATPPWVPTATLGSPCDNPASRSALDRMCKLGLVCVPEAPNAATGICRDTCAFAPTGSVFLACAPPFRCVAPLEDARPPLSPVAATAGVCVP